MTTTLPGGARAAESDMLRAHPQVSATAASAPSDWEAIRAGVAEFRAGLMAQRAAVGAACAWLALIAFITAAIGYRPVSRLLDNVTVTWAVIWTVVGVALVGAAIVLHPRAHVRPWAAAPALSGSWRPALTLAGLLLLALGTEVSAGLTGMAWIEQVTPTGQFILLLSGLLCFALGLIGVRGWRFPCIRWRDVLIVGAIVGGALILRGGGLDYYIRHSVDEVHFSDGVEFFHYDYRGGSATR